MSRPEHIKHIERATLKPYVLGGNEIVVVVVNKGALPKSEKKLTRNERKAIKDTYLGRFQGEPVNLSARNLEGTLFTFNGELPK